jgi:hypothetical protein
MARGWLKVEERKSGKMLGASVQDDQKEGRQAS